MSDWSDIALPEGSPGSGSIGLRTNFTIPESEENDTPASERQVDSVRQFFGKHYPDLTDSQAHKMLSAREYARFAADALASSYPSNLRRYFTLGLAAFIMSDPEIAEFARRWSEKNFKNAVSSPRVKGTQFFPELEAFYEYLEGSLEMNGWTKETLRRLTWNSPEIF